MAAAKQLQTVLGDLRDVQQVTQRLVDCPPGDITDRALATAVRRTRALEQQVPAAVDGVREP